MKVTLIHITPNPEQVIEQAGRTAYKSQSKITGKSAGKFIKMLIKLGHLSVLEHAVASFRVSGVSRALTHQLVRHRVASFTQQSQRYVSESNFDYIIPDKIKTNAEALKIFNQTMESVKDCYKDLINLKIPKEDARFIIPNAVHTEIVITANLREYRHIFDLRCKGDAQWEIRRMAIEMLKTLKQNAPNVFFDYEIDEKKNKAYKVKK
ncbi:FAD-dependent thymidylate synthase [Candidatus Dependentiae bacterium]|nr:FAD-dependent thymidylate synthase [Candidatus Dependentiae bacterium]